MRKCSLLISVVFLSFCLECAAQTLTNNNALITITPGTRMSIVGGALNNGDLANNGTLSITGDWMNVDTYSPGNGVMILNGSDQQNIAHNGQDVYQLLIEGGGEKNISSSLQVLDTLVFTNGLVTISNGANLLVQANGSVIGGSEDSYVDGNLFHQGTGYKFFPVGFNGNYRPAELLNVTGTDPVVGISVHEPNADPVVPLQIITVSEVRYWQMTHLSGNYMGSQIRLKVGSDELLGNPESQDIVVTTTDSIGGIFLSLGQSQFSGSLLDGEIVSSMPALTEFYALGVEGFAEERSLYIPNALSPAAPDPEDQVIKVYGQQIEDEDFIFRIYNRWGHIVYETDSFVEANSVGWTGESSSGKEESVGVYHYTLAGRFVSGNPFKRQGSITIIR